MKDDDDDGDGDQGEMRFDGTDYVPPRDRARLTTQHLRVRAAALAWPGGWFTMYALAQNVKEPGASVEKQVRNLRLDRFGAYTVEKRHKSGGTFEYRVMLPRRGASQ